MLPRNYDNYFEDMGKYLYQFQRIAQLFQSWHYKPAIIPLVDGYDQYRNITDTSNNFRVIDANQEVLILRADSTLFLARMISQHLHPEMLPLRLCYSNSVMQPSETQQAHEIWQNGIELIGVPSIAGDFEIILLTHTALQHIVPNQYRIHIGSREIIETGAKHINPKITAAQIKQLFTACLKREFDTCAQYTSEKFAHILLTIMDIEEFKENASILSSLVPTTAMDTAMKKFHDLIEALSQVIDPSLIRCDFSEIGHHDYYSNIVFSVFLQEKPTPVALGGRYDSLMNYLGTSVPAVGATIFSHLLIPFSSLPSAESNTHTASPFNLLSDVPVPTVEDLVQCATAQQGDTT